MRFYFLIASVLISTSHILISCNYNDTENIVPSPVMDDSIVQRTNKIMEIKRHVDTIPIISQNQIIGIWTTYS